MQTNTLHACAVAEIDDGIEFLYALEQKNKELAPAPRPQSMLLGGAPRAGFLHARTQLLQTMAAVAHDFSMHRSVVFLGAALFDRCCGVQTMDMQLQTLAVFVLATKFLHGAELPLVACARSWHENNRLQCTEHEYCALWRKTVFTGAELRAAEVAVGVLLDWRFCVATADNFVRAFNAKHSLGAWELCATEKGTFEKWVSYFSEMGVMHIFSDTYSQSVLASACVLASGRILHWESIGAEEQFLRFGMRPGAETDSCVADLLMVHETYHECTRHTMQSEGRTDNV